MGFSISGPGNAFMQISEVGLNKATNKINSIFDIENPDGVQSLIQDQLDSGVLTSFDNSVNLGIPGVSGQAAEGKTTSYGKAGTLYNNDVASEKFKITEVEGKDATTVELGPRPYSLFNKFSLVNYRGTPLNPEGSKSEGKSKFYNKIDPNTLINPSASKIIEITGSIKNNFGYRYDYSDFALAKYFGKIPNNMMITLRRFAFPAPDDIVSPVGGSGEGQPQPDIARAVTWMSEESGNSIGEIIKFDTGYGWDDAEAEMQTLQSKRGARSGIVGKKINESTFLSAAANAANGVNALDAITNEANAGFDSFKDTYPNHVFGPLNVIKNVLVRKSGLSFNQEFTLKFEYELRDLNGANPKVLMLDQLSNILALTYSNAPFWGGGARYIGDGSVAKPLGDIAKLRAGDYKGFLGSVVSDFTGKNTGNVFGDITEGFKSFLGEGGPGKMLNQFLQGGLAQLFNTPQGGEAAAALLSGDPTGQWHITIGNPLNPIAVIGNLACTGTNISFDGAMGVQDFPERMIVTITLKPGRPRDKAEIESMFNSGRGRFYLQPDDVADINKTLDVSAYGNKDNKKYVNTFRKLSNG